MPSKANAEAPSEDYNYDEGMDINYFNIYEKGNGIVKYGILWYQKIKSTDENLFEGEIPPIDVTITDYKNEDLCYWHAMVDSENIEFVDKVWRVEDGQKYYTYVYRVYLPVTFDHKILGDELHLKVQSDIEMKYPTHFWDSAWDDMVIDLHRFPSFKEGGVRVFWSSYAPGKAKVTIRAKSEKFQFCNVFRDHKMIAEQKKLLMNPETGYRELIIYTDIPYDRTCSIAVRFGKINIGGYEVYCQDSIERTVKSMRMKVDRPKVTQLTSSKMAIEAKLPQGADYMKIQKYNPNKARYEDVGMSDKNTTYIIDYNKYSKKYYRLAAYRNTPSGVKYEVSKSTSPYPNKIFLEYKTGIGAYKKNLKAVMGMVSYDGKDIYVGVKVKNQSHYTIRKLSKIRVYLKVGKNVVFDRRFPRV